MDLEHYLIFSLSILLIIIGILLLPIFICYSICKRIDWSIIKNIYYIWFKK